MRSEYVDEVNERRRRLGIGPLGEDGTPTSEESTALCRQQATQTIEESRARVDEVMFYKWDPLNLSNSNWPRDEYKSYVPQVFKLALESASYQPIAERLTYFATEIMSVTEDKAHDEEIAQLIFSLVKDEAHFPDHTVVEVD